MYKKIANGLSYRLNKSAQLDGIEKIKLDYGLEILVSNFISLIIISCIASCFGYLIEVAIVLTTFKLCRNNAHGLHAKNNINCLISSSIVLVIVPSLIKNLMITDRFIIVFGLVYIVLFALYAPADTEKHPIVLRESRNRLRFNSVLTVTVVLIVALLIDVQWVKLCIFYGLTIETVSILPIMYILLNKRRNNYEKYNLSHQ